MDKVMTYLGLRDDKGTSVFRFDTPYAWVALGIALAVIIVLGKFVF